MKNTFKKLLSLALAVVMCFSLASCGSVDMSKADMSTSDFHKYIGHTKDEVFDYLGLSDFRTKSEKSKSGDIIYLKDKFEYGGCKASVEIDLMEENVVYIAYQFGTVEKNGEEYQKAAFDYAKAIEKLFSSEYKAVEHYNGDLDVCTEEEYMSDPKGKAHFREYHIDDEFGIIELTKKYDKTAKWDELHLTISLEKVNMSNADKITKVHIGLRPATKVNPQ